MTARKSKSSSSPKWLTILLGRSGLALAFLWGFAEGTFFFIIPDLVLTLTALFSFKQALRQTTAVLAGSILAGALMFNWASSDHARSYEAVMSIPFVNDTMADTVHKNLEAHGSLGLIMGPFSGIPYKLYAVESPERIDFIPFILTSIPARLARFAGGLILFGAIGFWQRRRIQTHPNRTLTVYAIYWTVVYTFYWGNLTGT